MQWKYGNACTPLTKSRESYRGVNQHLGWWTTPMEPGEGERAEQL